MTVLHCDYNFIPKEKYPLSSSYILENISQPLQNIQENNINYTYMYFTKTLSQFYINTCKIVCICIEIFIYSGALKHMSEKVIRIYLKKLL